MIETGVVFALTRGNKILMQQRDKNCKQFPLMWCIPGGGSDEGESWEETLLREVKEEYGLDIHINQCSYLMDYQDGIYPLRVYLCRIREDQEPELKEGLAMKWMMIHEIEKLKLAFDQEGIIPVLRTALL